MVDNIVAILKDLGHSEYESKAYVALLEGHPMTAYEAAKQGGIPTPKIYAVLEKLVKKGLVQILEDRGKKRYIPMEAEDFLSSQKRRFSEKMERLEEGFKSIEMDQPVSYVWNIRKTEDLLKKALQMIHQCKESILLSLWPQEWELLKKPLKELERQGINIAVVHFGDILDKLGQCYLHPIEETLFQEKGGRSFSMVCDSSIALMGTIDGEQEVDASWSRSPGFTSLAEDYIRHDIYIMKIVKRFDSQLIQAFGPGYKLLRQVFADQEVQ